MNQYQRMVSYLYQYHQGEKGENVGYVRVECKQQQCRIVIKMRPVTLEHMPEIRLFIQEPDGLMYVPAGTLSVGGNSLERQLVTMSENVFQSGKSIDSFEGLLLYVSAKTYFATSWKNDRIFLGDMRTFSENGTAESKTPENEIPNNVTPENSNTLSNSLQEVGNMVENSDNRQTDYGKITDNSSDSQTDYDKTTDSKTGYDKATGNSSGTYSNQAGHNAANSSNMRQTYSNTNMPVQNNNSDIHAAMVEGELTAAEESIVNMSLKRNIQHKEPENRRKTQFAENEKPFDENEVEMQSVCSVCPFKRKTLDYGKRMLYTFPHMHPFPDGRVRECVRIEPQDIGCLPIRLWSLANNNFLLQGYFNYRHLLFLELKDGNYAIGVPGIFTQKENGTAHRFAFPHFMPLSSDENCNGAFGYWLQTLPRTLS